MKRGELLARIKAHLRVKNDATWVQSIVKGVLTEDSEAMKILESILPESIISRIQVSLRCDNNQYAVLPIQQYQTCCNTITSTTTIIIIIIIIVIVILIIIIIKLIRIITTTSSRPSPVHASSCS